jgi:regulatory protein
MLITAILPAPRQPGRFAVMIDGKQGAMLSIDAVERLHLATGVELDEAAMAAIEREAAVLATYDRALMMLAARGRASMELRRLLIRKGEPPDHVDAAIVRLTAAGYLDDAAFARHFAHSKLAGAGLSKRRLEQELGKRGVARDVAAPAIAEVFESEGVDESASIERVARKKLRSLGGADEVTRRRRLYGFLARRGYEPDEISRVLRVIGAGEE